MFVSVAITFYSFALSAAKVSALEFRFCRVNPLPKQKLTFDERKSAVSRGTVIFRREVI